MKLRYFIHWIIRVQLLGFNKKKKFKPRALV